MEAPTNYDKPRPSEGLSGSNGRLPLMALNHVSRLCRSVEDSADFYANVLGFVPVERPEALDFDGAWLFNYGVGIHLVRCTDDEKLPPVSENGPDPMDNHISFQCEDMEAVEEKLEERGVKCLRRTVEDENGTKIDQLFFNDPDGFMIEICNCENLKLRPAGSLGEIRLPADRHNPPLDLDGPGKALE
ncbi:hypothetical protein MLD38_008869 [Melastoma candidum]|uniref:Uncharacterized protein n=1 Tax=Melastoma candidum TaxID=119954 RepID=A0ACB9RX13_9MYRT|nr:hypothetical protein MLD38_008869 [Melastoma candidum]